MNTFEKITNHIKTPFMTKVCSTLTKDEHIDSMTHIILEINKKEDAKFLAEIIHTLQRKLYEYENKNWKKN